MKYLITAIAAILLTGCVSTPDHSGTYTLSYPNRAVTMTLQLKPDGSFTYTRISRGNGRDDPAIGSWKVKGELLVCKGTTVKSSQNLIFKFNKTSRKLISISVRLPIDNDIPEGEDGHYFKKSVEPIDEAAKVELTKVKTPDLTIHDAAGEGNIEAVKQHLAAGTDVNAKYEDGDTPLDIATDEKQTEIADLLRKHGGKTGEELKAEGK